VKMGKRCRVLVAAHVIVPVFARPAEPRAVPAQPKPSNKPPKLVRANRPQTLSTSDWREQLRAIREKLR
jgi:hypothetical protein